MISSFDDETIQCPYCGCSTMIVTRTGQVTETKMGKKTFQIEVHNPKVALICKECNSVIREYDEKKLLQTGE